MSALCAGGRLCSAALWYRAPPAGSARNLLRRRIQGRLQHCINGYSESQEGQGGGGQGDDPQTKSPLGVRTWRRRSLSPLDRVSRIIPPEFISQEIRDLQSPPESPSSKDHLQQLQPPEHQAYQDHPPQQLGVRTWRWSLSPLDRVSGIIPPNFMFQEIPPPTLSPPEPQSPQDHPQKLSPSELPSLCGPNGSPEDLTGRASPDPYSPPVSSPGHDQAPSLGVPFQAGDIVLAEFKRRHYSMFRKMFILKNTGKLVSNWGAVSYTELLGKLPGMKIRTSTGHRLLLRRPSLDEYVMYMKRGPTISYPKDIASMLLMMDVNPGDVILEAGSGSGALSLFLSRAVGSGGRVHSVEVRSDHHRVAKRNFLKWKEAWEIRSGRMWPDNVDFINKNVLDALSDLRSVGFDAVALDMLNPHVELPAITRNLKQGAVCSVYITNITQVIDLLEGIRACELPLLCEKVMEVSITDWLVAPSRQKDGRISKRVEPKGNWSPETQTPEPNDDDDQTDDDDIGSQAFGQMPYIARPMPWQIGHTAFLVQLRKVKEVEDPGAGASS